MLASQQVRLNIRNGTFQQPTAGAAPGFVQANLVILPKALASDFQLFCQRNPKPCPILSIADVGGTDFPALGRTWMCEQIFPAIGFGAMAC